MQGITSMESRDPSWERMVSEMRANSSGIDWSKVDWSKLKPSDIGVTFGRPMTEEEFKKYKAAKNVKILKPGGT